MSKKIWLTLMLLVSIVSVVVWHSESDAAPANDRWQHRIIVLEVVVADEPRRPISTARIEKMLTEEGKQGWELAAIQDSTVQCETVSVWVYLKRKL